MNNQSYQLSEIQLPSDSLIRNRVLTMNEKDTQDITFFQRFCSIFTLEYYREYFEVTTELVFQRFISTFNPFKGTFFDIGAGIPDLYGPFWILNTLIFSMTLSANLTKYFQLKPGEQFQYNFALVPLAASILYLKTIIIPMIYRLALKCYDQQRLTYLHCLCIYGYSAAIMIPVSILNIIPNPAIQWMLLIYVIFAQTAFLTSNFNNEMKFLASEKKYIVIGVIAIIQITLMIVYKFYFFKTENYEQLGLVKQQKTTDNFHQHLDNHS